MSQGAFIQVTQFDSSTVLINNNNHNFHFMVIPFITYFTAIYKQKA